MATNNHYINTKNIHQSHTKPKKYTQQNVSFSDTPLFFPEGFEKIFLAIYFISLPYIAGLLFLFFYIATGDPKLFLSLNEESSFLLTWTIGYEIIAGFTILYIIKMALSFANESRKPGLRQFRRP
ncbi:MAG: hypothetical protein E3J96_06480 [Sulfurovum sp.]|nr:MAG: hypothetical protein E3J96_06480 [Sulfurovum sp.]